MRTVLDYDRFETGQLVPRDDRFRLGEAAAEPIETLRRAGDDGGAQPYATAPAGPRAHCSTAIAS